MLKIGALLCCLTIAFAQDCDQSEWTVESQRETPGAAELGLPAGTPDVIEKIDTSFTCVGRKYGYFADVRNECKLFHICRVKKDETGRDVYEHYSFLCPAGTRFDQESAACLNAADVSRCPESESLFAITERKFSGTPDADVAIQEPPQAVAAFEPIKESVVRVTQTQTRTHTQCTRLVPVKCPENMVGIVECKVTQSCMVYPSGSPAVPPRKCPSKANGPYDGLTTRPKPTEPPTTTTIEPLSEEAKSLGLAHGADYAVSYQKIDTTFSCRGREYGYYADVKNDCRLYHVCQPVVTEGVQTWTKNSFFCPIGTQFDQEKLSCFIAPEVKCYESERFYEQTAAKFRPEPQAPVDEAPPSAPGASGPYSAPAEGSYPAPAPPVVYGTTAAPYVPTVYTTAKPYPPAYPTAAPYSTAAPYTTPKPYTPPPTVYTTAAPYTPPAPYTTAAPYPTTKPTTAKPYVPVPPYTEPQPYPTQKPYPTTMQPYGPPAAPVVNPAPAAPVQSTTCCFVFTQCPTPCPAAAPAAPAAPIAIRY